MTKKMTIELPDGVKFVQRYLASGSLPSPQEPRFDIIVPTPEAAAELKKRIDEALAKLPAGMPEEGQEVFVLDASGGITSYLYDGSSLQAAYWRQGNIFFTRELAEKDRDRRKALQRVKAWIAKNTEPFEPDWESASQEKYSIAYNHSLKQFSSVSTGIFKALGDEVFFASWDDAQRCIRECESDLRTLAGVE